MNGSKLRGALVHGRVLQLIVLTSEGTYITRHTRVSFCAILLALATLPLFSPVTTVRAAGPVAGSYSLSSVPAFTQEGNTVSLILTLSGLTSTLSTTYEFRFSVTDPAGTTFQSQPVNYTTQPGQYQFSILVTYPSASFPGSNWLVGQYGTSVDQLFPIVSPPTVATSSFFLSLTDSSEYQRTQTVNVQANGYNASETVNVVIRQTSGTIVFSQPVQASASGLVTASWDIPVNATTTTYMVTLTGTSTVKSRPDTQQFSVNPATMSVTAIVSLKSIYQRTETMVFSFQPTYPDGSIATNGIGVINLMNPYRKNVTLTTTYISSTQTFNVTYTTAASSLTGTWTATLFSHSFNDGYGNSGPSARVSTSPQLTLATLSVIVTTDTNFVLGQQTKFNASIAYPDGTKLTTGAVGAYLLYSGTPVINETIPLVYDTGLRLWVGTYTPKASDTGGLWSLVVKASDSSQSPDTGSATRAITLQNNTSPQGGNSVSFPLYYFGIIAALIAGLLIAGFLAFRRRRVTHARLKIDLEAVRSEAGRIESQDFFKSIKDQVAKNEDQQ